MRVVLYEPEIPQNTGSIARSCAALRVPLELIEPLGFAIDERRIRRAGLDYWPWVHLHIHRNYQIFLQSIRPGSRLLMLTTKASRRYDTIEYQPSDYLMFGPESRGLPADILQDADEGHLLKIPILEDNVRSLNLSNAVSIVLYEAQRQLGFPGG